MDPQGIRVRILMINGPNFCWWSCNCWMFTVWFVPSDALKKAPSYRVRNPWVPVSGLIFLNVTCMGGCVANQGTHGTRCTIGRRHTPRGGDAPGNVLLSELGFFHLCGYDCDTHTTLMSAVSAGKRRKFMKGLRSSGQLSRCWLGLQTEQIFIQSRICGTCWTNSQRRSGQNVFFSDWCLCQFRWWNAHSGGSKGSLRFIFRI